MFHSLSFDVSKAINTFSGIDLALKCIQQIGKNEEKITNTWRFKSIVTTIGIKTQMMKTQKTQQWKTHIWVLHIIK